MMQPFTTAGGCLFPESTTLLRKKKEKQQIYEFQVNGKKLAARVQKVKNKTKKTFTDL